MKIRKSIFLLCVVAIFMIGACGCMKHSKYEEIILEELSNRYDKKFEIVSLSYEVSGDVGSFYRAVCREIGKTETFVALYYLNGSDYLLFNEGYIEESQVKGTPVLIDGYIELLFSLQLQEEILSWSDDILFAIADIGAIDSNITIEDIDKGVTHFIADEMSDSQLELYIFVDHTVSEKETFNEKIVNKVLSLNACRQTIDILYVPKSDKDNMKIEYQGDTYMIEDRLKKDDRVSKYNWYFATRHEGVTTSKCVKGV